MRALVDGETDVVIVGAGPVGLAAAIELGQRGVRCIVVERHDRVGYSPRAKTTNVRSREHLRRWGIADALRRASPISPNRPSTVVFATRMNGPLIARFENALNGAVCGITFIPKKRNGFRNTCSKTCCDNARNHFLM
jgi:FAD binding domain